MVVLHGFAKANDCWDHRNGNLDANYEDMSVDSEDKLDIMEGFVRVTPMPVKSGEMVFLCNCCDAYHNYGCEHSGCSPRCGIRT